MTIWVIGRNYPSEKNNLQGSFEFEQAKMLEKKGHQVSYISCLFHTRKKSKKWGYDAWKENGVSIYTYAQVFFPERFRIHLDRVRIHVWEKLLSTVKAESGVPDVIHIHYPSYIGVAKVFLPYQQKGTKIVCTEHWTRVLNQSLDNYESHQIKSYVKYADAFLCVGHTLKKAIIEITGTSKVISVVPNIVNTDIFKPTENKVGGYHFVAVGVLIPHKQFDKIITAFAQAFQELTDVTLTIIGDGSEMAALNRLVKERHMESQIILTGQLDRTATAKQIAGSDCLICYSRLETFGVPVIEGWACGIPVIASTGTAVIDEWDNNLGLQTDPKNICDLEEKMRKIYQNPDNYDDNYISDYAKANYSEDVIYNKLLNSYIG